jgi:type VI secretion system secreted protein VgrG
MPILELEVASGDPLSVRRFVVREAVSEPFDLDVETRSSDPSLDLDAIVGHPATFRIVTGLAGAHRPARRWTGICRSAEQVQAEPSGLSTYRFQLVPALWLLTQRTDHRIVQHRSAPDLARDLLDLWRIDRALAVEAAAHPALPYKVQYGESDHAFFCRVLAEAGIAFTFPEADAGPTVLTLSDRLEGGAPRLPVIAYVSSPNEAAEREMVTDVHLTDESRPGAYAIRDHDLRRPAYRLLAEAPRAPAPEAAREQYHYRPGAFLVETTPSGDTPVADYGGAARHDLQEGRRLAERSLHAERADKRVVTYRTNVLDLWPGRVFTLADHPHPDLSAGQKLLVTGLTLEGAPGESWTILGRAVFADTPYRPPMRTPRPRARIQSATVVGPASEEIHTDEFGRVRVRFPWDRGEGTSCWIRVSQAWAGAGFGMMALPRIGQEVLVDFLGGDPEQPVVVGRVFNPANPVVERLPEHATKSAWKSNTTPVSNGFNEVLFEDRKGSELVYAQAERDARRLVKHDDTSTIGRDRWMLVERSELSTTGVDRVEETRRDRVELTYGDRTTAVDRHLRDRVDRQALERVETEQARWVGHDEHTLTRLVLREQIERDLHLGVGGGRPEAVGGTDSLSVHEAFNETVGTYAVTADGPKGWIHLLAGAKGGGMIVVESDAELTVAGAGGASFIKIEPGTITIVGPQVYINDGGDGPNSLPGPGPRLPEPPTMAVVAEPPPPSLPAPTTERGVYELVVVDEGEAPIVGLEIQVTTPAGVTSETTDEDGRIVVDQAPPGEATAWIEKPREAAARLQGRHLLARRTTPVPRGEPWIVRTPTDLADAILLHDGKPRKLMIVTRTDLAHLASGSAWTSHALADAGSCVLKKAAPVLVQMNSDGSATQAVVVGHGEKPAPTATAPQDAPAPEEQPHAPEWLRAIIDSLHDALYKGSFEVVWSILEKIPLDPPRPPITAAPSPVAEEAAFQAALARLASQGIVDSPFVEDPYEP